LKKSVTAYLTRFSWVVLLLTEECERCAGRSELEFLACGAKTAQLEFFNSIGRTAPLAIGDPTKPLQKPIRGCADRNNSVPQCPAIKLVLLLPKDTIMEVTSGANSTSAHCDSISDRWTR